MSDLDMWDELENGGNVIVPAQQAIAVFQNQRGHVVIRQQAEHHPDEDHWVVITPQNVTAVAYALLDAAGIDAEIAGRVNGGYVDIPRPNASAPVTASREASKDPTGAERQRRYREKQKAAGAEGKDGTGRLHLEGPDQ